MKLIITGATGTAGFDVLREALADPRVEKVVVLARKNPGIQSPKMKVLIHSDFLDYTKILSELKGHDACLWCLGVAQSDVSAEEYQRITYDYALTAAKVMGSINPKFTFCFLSGQGADSREKSRILFARIKGKTENALSALGHPKVFHFRPGYIHAPENRSNKLLDKYLFRALAPLLYRIAPGAIISTFELAKAMINVAAKEFEKAILENNDIRTASLG